MKVSELKEILNEFDDDLEVVVEYDEDYGICGRVTDVFQVNCVEDMYGEIIPCEEPDSNPFEGREINRYPRLVICPNRW